MIRPLTPADLDRVMEIWLTANLEAHPFVDAAYWHKNLAPARVGIAQAEVYLAGQDGEVLGFVGLVDDYIAGIFVDRHHRNAGVGRALMEHLFTVREHLTLQVYAENSRAVDFYRRLGFTVTAEGTDPDTGSAELTMDWHRKPV